MIIAFNIGDSDCDVHNLMQLYGLTHEHSNNELGVALLEPRESPIFSVI